MSGALHHPHPWPLLWMTWLLALAATAAVLFLGEVMGMALCVLCEWAVELVEVISRVARTRQVIVG